MHHRSGMTRAFSNARLIGTKNRPHSHCCTTSPQLRLAPCVFTSGTASHVTANGHRPSLTIIGTWDYQVTCHPLVTPPKSWMASSFWRVCAKCSNVFEVGPRITAIYVPDTKDANKLTTVSTTPKILCHKRPSARPKAPFHSTGTKKNIRKMSTWQHG